MNYFRLLIRKHEELKKRIHSFRMPLSPLGQKMMSIVYFSIPIIGGYYIMQAAIRESDKNMDQIKAINDNQSRDVTRAIKDQNQALNNMIFKKYSNNSNNNSSND